MPFKVAVDEALIERVPVLPPAGPANLGRILQLRKEDFTATKLFGCVQNSADGWEWIQLSKST